MKYITVTLVLAGITLTAGLAHANTIQICREENRGGDQVTVCYTEEAFEEMQREEQELQRAERVQACLNEVENRRPIPGVDHKRATYFMRRACRE